MQYYIECPYYLDHKYHATTIVCEDCSHEYFTKEARDKRLEEVCEKNWSSCAHAIALTNLYERTENMNLTAKEKAHLQHTCEEQKTELTKIRKQYKYIAKEKEKLEREVKALTYLVDSKEKTLGKAADRLFLEQERQRGLLALIGYMAEESGIKDFSLHQVQRFAKNYDTMCTVDTAEADDGVSEIRRVYIEAVEKDLRDDKSKTDNDTKAIRKSVKSKDRGQK